MTSVRSHTSSSDGDAAPPLNSSRRAIDKIDPFVKSDEYLKYYEHRHRRRRSRSRSRSRSRHRRRRRSSSSRSRSRSGGRRPSHHHRRHRSSRSRSRSRRRHRRRHRSRSRGARAPKAPTMNPDPEVDEAQEEEEEEEEEEDPSKDNVYKNDGSFMEMFKKMQEEQMRRVEQSVKEEPADLVGCGSGGAKDARPPLPAFGKRRGGKVLKTGMVQKVVSKDDVKEEGGEEAQDAWTMYMKEVKRYKEACCDDDSKTRLLVK